LAPIESFAMKRPKRDFHVLSILVFAAASWVATAFVPIQPEHSDEHGAEECKDAEGCQKSSTDDGEDMSFLQFQNKLKESAAAGAPIQIIAQDLVGVHDLLMLGYYGVMTNGPQLRDQVRVRIKECHQDHKNASGGQCLYTQIHTNFSESEKTYKGLTQARAGAIDLAKLLPLIHPDKGCRTDFGRNKAACEKNESCTDERLVEMQAHTSWACIGIHEDMILPTCSGKEPCGPTDVMNRKFFTTFRNENGSLIQSTEVAPYRNFVLKSDAPALGACAQQVWKGDGLPKGKTLWLRACSFWASFHTMALRADSVGEDAPDRMMAAVARIVSGGALWCGG